MAKTLKKFVLKPKLVFTIIQRLTLGELRHNTEKKVPSLHKIARTTHGASTQKKVKQIQRRHKCPSSRHSFLTSLISTALAVLTRPLRTRPLLWGKHSSTSAFGQQPRGVLLSHNKTRAPGSKFGDAVHHFCLGCSKGRYSDNHLFQNLSASACVLR